MDGVCGEAEVTTNLHVCTNRYYCIYLHMYVPTVCTYICMYLQYVHTYVRTYSMYIHMYVLLHLEFEITHVLIYIHSLYYYYVYHRSSKFLLHTYIIDLVNFYYIVLYDNREAML